MKSLFTFALSIAVSAFCYSQNVGFTYQAVAIDESRAEGFGKDSRGEILVNQPIGVRFSIHEGESDGVVRYQEYHDTATDVFGIFRLIVGRGYDISGGPLEDLEWGIKPYFLQVDIDLGDGFKSMGAEELFGSPYALNARKQTLDLVQNLLSISGGNSVILADNDPENELIRGITLSGSLLTIVDAGGNHTVDLASIGVANISEAQVDSYVNNNGYLTAESQTISTNGDPGNISISNGDALSLNVNDADADPLNEIQDLQIAENVLTITENNAATEINLTPYLDAAFSTDNNTTSNAPGNYTNDSFVFGGPSLDQDNNASHYNRFFFDKVNGAFRAGASDNDSWDVFNRGMFSTAFGRNSIASGDYSFAGGSGSNSFGVSSFAFGQGAIANNDFSIALGVDSYAGGIGAIAIGSNTFTDGLTNYGVAIGNGSQVFGESSVSIGYNNISHAHYSTVFGSGNASWSFGETLVGLYSTPSNFASFNTYISTDRLFTVGNGINDMTRSDALVMLKNGNTRLHGRLTIDADNVNGVGQGYTLPGQDGIANQVLVTDGGGNVSWTSISGSGITETEIDDFVSDNGYLTTEVDGSITNEIQDLAIADDVLSITNNPASTNIDLTPYRNVFEITNHVTSNERGDYATDDFVFGSPQMNDDGNPQHRNRFFFDKSKGALRTGSTNGIAWNDANVGHYSTAFGFNGVSSGTSSFTTGEGNISTGATSSSLGAGNTASGTSSFAAGISNVASSHNTVALGFANQAVGQNSIAIGDNSIASGDFSKVFAVNSVASSFGETVLGMLSTDYTSSPLGGINSTDRLFTIGNGRYDFTSGPPYAFTRSDALVMLKNGNTRLHGQLTIDADNVNGAGEEYTLPGQDGAANQVMSTDGNGNVTWSTPAILSETDVDGFVSNNGFLTAEVDGSVTNELQDLAIANDVLSITNNPAPTNIDLAPYRNVFEITNNVTSNENGNYDTDDFVFGSPQLDDDGNANHRSRMFFDKSKAAFRVGSASGNQWDDINVGLGSIGLGVNTMASGLNSFAGGGSSAATGSNAVAIGYFANANGSNGVAIGNNSTAITSSVGIGSGARANGSSAISLGGSSEASASNAIAIGTYSVASGNTSIAFGHLTNATFQSSIAIGHFTNATATGAIAIGPSAYAFQSNANAIGNAASAVGTRSTALGNFVVASSFGETALGIYNDTQNYSPNTNSYVLTDRLFVIGNGTTTNARSNAFVMLKNGNTRLHGELTIDADNVNGVGEHYTFPGQDGAANQSLVTDGNGTVSWTNADNSTSNEIQDLTLNTATNTLSISQDPTPATTVDLTPYRNVFEITNGVTSNENGNYATDDFVFGGADLNGNGTKFFFDKSKYAFRVGQTIDNSWSDGNIGTNSFAAGFNSLASGTSSVAFGVGSHATGSVSFAAGQGNQSHGQFSFSAGETNVVHGDNSVAIGRSSIISSSAQRAVALGGLNRIYGWGGVTIGNWLRSGSFSEVVLGHASTEVAPISDIAWVPTDRLFVIGNGAPIDFTDLTQPPNRSDALVMLKSGNTRLHGQLTIDADNVNGAGEPYTLPGQDGAANQVMSTDGNGNVTWSTPAILSETDVDGFVSNNGFLTTEVDGSVTNEIQDLAIANDVLSITNNPAPTNIDLAPYRNVFETTNNVTSNENGDYATDDFVFGSPQLADDGDATHDRRMFFDKSKGAFRAGTVTGNQWDDAAVGVNSFGFGSNSIATGSAAVSIGSSNTASGTYSIAIGLSNNVSGHASVALGAGNLISPNSPFSGNADAAVALGSTNSARSYGAVAMGYNNQATGYISTAIGYSNIASADVSLAMGHLTTASGARATAFGYQTTASGWTSLATGRETIASGQNSAAFGYQSIASGLASSVFGYQTNGAGAYSLASGRNSTASGQNSSALGYRATAPSFGEIAIGLYSTTYIPSSATQWDAGDRLFVIGNGQPNLNTFSDALVMLKNGNTRLHGQLTIDADNVTGAGGSYTFPGQRGTNGQVMMTDGIGNVSWRTPAALVEVDGSITNEIQDLAITNDVLTITNNAAPTNIDLAPYRNVFETTSNITSNENGDYANDSFIFGSAQLDDDNATTDDNTRMLFEKSTGAFRVGTVSDTRWDAAERGTNSVAMGLGNIARGNSSLSIGQNNLAHSASSVAIGTNNQAEGYNSVALGRNVATTGVHSMGLSLYSSSRSYGETTMGIYAADYVPNSTTNFDANDRLFTIGNGLDDGNRSNALVISKNGNTNLNGELTIDADNNAPGQGYTLPGQDGFSGQLLVTDGAGHASWSNIINGDLTVSGVFTNPSDSRLKRNITPLKNSLFHITALNGFHYNWNSNTTQDTLALQTGLIAQEVEKIFPELVKTDSDGFKSVNYIGLIPHLVEAVKVLREENDLLKRRNETIEKDHQQTKTDATERIKQMEIRLEAIESLLSATSKKN